MIIKVVFILSMVLILYSYGGYYVLLHFMAIFRKRPVMSEDEVTQNFQYPQVSVIIAAHNEERIIEYRIKNILEQSYPNDRTEIIIASDGSSDNTVRIAGQYENVGVKVLDFKERRGRALVHNDAVKVTKGDIVIFSDAGTSFKEDFLQKIVQNFRAAKIGGVVGKLVYLKGEKSISESENIYLRLEFKMRELESRIGILSIGSGACLAIRKMLFQPLRKNEDIDDIFPLQCLRSGYRMIMDPGAVACDNPPSTIQSEIRARIRMTAQGFRGTIRNWRLGDMLSHPFVTWGLFSHKILRWLTPYLLLIALVMNILLIRTSVWFLVILAFQLMFYFLALVGLFGHFLGKRLFWASHFFSFCVANVGMMVGVMKGFLGKAPATYDQD